jgi:hypothetical protein
MVPHVVLAGEVDVPRERDDLPVGQVERPTGGTGEGESTSAVDVAVHRREAQVLVDPPVSNSAIHDAAATGARPSRTAGTGQIAKILMGGVHLA